MLRSGDPVSFAAVARTARVSTWLVYAEGVREAEPAPGGRDPAAELSPWPASISCSRKNSAG
jgi:hypothetical protein